MSGGYAYVLDESGDLEKRCNPGMVELEALSSDDAAFVASLLAEHAKRTGSPKAADLLARWELSLTKFVKVVPIEYRRVLEDMQRREKGSAGARPVLHP
jgi:glutamate synthase domain-containing protein 3